MTAVASPPSFPQISRPAWGSTSSSMNPDDLRGMLVPRKTLSRTNSSSSVSSTSSTSSATTVATNGSSVNSGSGASHPLAKIWSHQAPRKRPQQKSAWPDPNPDLFPRVPAGRPPVAPAGQGQPLQPAPGPMAGHGGALTRPGGEQPPQGLPVLYLLSLNGTFDRKTISVPFSPESLRIGRQTNQKTVPTPLNGFFDSKVLSRQHAEIWAERSGKIFIRDVKSSNGTFVNGTRLSQENRESEPHELQTADHLELGIDIVHEDQKTVVHHKVAAKVEHAGFLNNSNSVLDMNFGDLDPANGSMMMQSQGPAAYRGRTGSNASMASNGRMVHPQNMAAPQVNGMQHQRPFWLTQVTTDQIVKKLHQEMRGARVQSQDLARTQQFVTTLLGKEDIKNEKAEGFEPVVQSSPIVNGNGMPFRTDPKTRFSDPPAPPPQHPLPEKPDVPALKRATTERPKSHPSNASPIPQDSINHIMSLNETLSVTKKNYEERLKDLEEKLDHERAARLLAEERARRLEEPYGGSSTKLMEGSADDGENILVDDTIYAGGANGSPLDNDDSKASALAAQDDKDHEKITLLQQRIDDMTIDFSLLKTQMESWKQRCEKAESERDASAKSLEQLVQEHRLAEESRQAAVQKRRRSRSGRRNRSRDGKQPTESTSAVPTESGEEGSSEDGAVATDGSANEKPSLSRASTITPLTTQLEKRPPDQGLQASLPYASMLGVVLIGWGLMAYFNGWQPPPPKSLR